MCKLPHELENDFRLMILVIQDILGKCQNFIKLWPGANSPCQKILLILAKQSKRLAIRLFSQGAISHENQNQSQTFCDLFSPGTFLLYVQVASRVGKRFQTYDLGNSGYIRKVPKLHKIMAWCQFSLPKNFVNTSQIVQKTSYQTSNSFVTLRRFRQSQTKV